MNKFNMLVPLIMLCVMTSPLCARGGGGFHGGGGGGFHGGGSRGGGMRSAGHSHASSASHSGHHGYNHGGQHGGHNWQQGHYYSGRGYWGYNPGFGWGFWPVAYAIVATDAAIAAAGTYDNDMPIDDSGDYNTTDNDRDTDSGFSN